MSKVLSNKKMIALLVLPGIIIFCLVILVPIFMSVFYSVTDYNGIDAMKFVGLTNYKKLIMDDKIMWLSIRNVFILSAGLIIIQHPLSIVCAIYVDKAGGVWEKIFRVLIFIPSMTSVVVTAKLWMNMLDPTFGLVNKILKAVGLTSWCQAWMTETTTALIAIVLIEIWVGFGWSMLIYYAGVKGIPADQIDAARIDGAADGHLITKIILPQLKPIIRINITLAIVNALKMMETVYLTTNGAPGNATQFVANYLYVKAFSDQKYGYANAISVVFIVICLIANFITKQITAERGEK
ncbi:carbohydrate ABC transporter permease [Diplocloster agilis]|uniref:Sugar ABC transporter permease n=1 Tax=Diplocloster agilis TaxID=2850323 RepID=A0A949NGA3_9FIRM|nr:sugar ABC transporter permease [Diplocloster agilis]MBU9736203.1 sugar ABC transporter permease [Diplocloster agilis]